MTNQHVVCLSSTPKTNGHTYPEKRPLPHNLPTTEFKAPPIAEIADGEAIIEVSVSFPNSYTSNYFSSTLKMNVLLTSK